MALLWMCDHVPAHCLRLRDWCHRISIDVSMDNAGVSQPHLLYHIHFMAAISLLYGRLLAMHYTHDSVTLATCLEYNKEGLQETADTKSFR